MLHFRGVADFSWYHCHLPVQPILYRDQDVVFVNFYWLKKPDDARCSWEDIRIPQIIEIKFWIDMYLSPENTSVKIPLPAKCTLIQKKMFPLFLSSWGSFLSQEQTQSPMKLPSSWDIYHVPCFYAHKQTNQKQKQLVPAQVVNQLDNLKPSAMSLSLYESERTLNYIFHWKLSNQGQPIVLVPKMPFEPRKKPSYFPLYWLFNTDLTMVYYNPHITG